MLATIHRTRERHVLTQGGLVRSLRLGQTGDTLHLWAQRPRPAPSESRSLEAEGACLDELIEIELLEIRPEKATIRIKAPAHFTIISAKKDQGWRSEERDDTGQGNSPCQTSRRRNER